MRFEQPRLPPVRRILIRCVPERNSRSNTEPATAEQNKYIKIYLRCQIRFVVVCGVDFVHFLCRAKALVYTWEMAWCASHQFSTDHLIYPILDRHMREQTISFEPPIQVLCYHPLVSQIIERTLAPRGHRIYPFSAAQIQDLAE